jgi:hypothetical protein
MSSEINSKGEEMREPLRKLTQHVRGFQQMIPGERRRLENKEFGEVASLICVIIYLTDLPKKQTNRQRNSSDSRS